MSDYLKLGIVAGFFFFLGTLVQVTVRPSNAEVQWLEMELEACKTFNDQMAELTPVPTRTQVSCPPVETCTYHAVPDLEDANVSLALAHQYSELSLDLIDKAYYAIPGTFVGELASAWLYLQEVVHHIESAGAEIEFAIGLEYFTCPINEGG